MISVADFVLFCQRTLDGYERALARLDDESVNRVPSTGGSTPFQLVTHALGACRWWTMHHVSGLPIERHRASEFEAVGTVADARALIADFRHDLGSAGPTLATASKVHGAPTTQIPLGQPWTIGACLIHAYEELAQHLGHLEATVDLVTA